MSRYGDIKKKLVSQSKGNRIEDEPAQADAPAVETEPTQTGTIGRPKTGKRSNPGFRSVSLWLRSETFADADAILTRRRRLDQIPESDPRDVSELVESLLADWLSEQPDK